VQKETIHSSQSNEDSLREIRQLRIAVQAYQERLEAQRTALVNSQQVIENWQDINEQTKLREKKYRRRALKAESLTVVISLVTLGIIFIGIPLAFAIGAWFNA
jgi:hypothetical protein